MEESIVSIPEVKSRYWNIYGPMIERIAGLPKGQSLKMVCKDRTERVRIMHALAENRRKRNLTFRVYRENDIIWAWNEEKK